MLFLIAVLTFASVALLVTYVFQPSSGTVRRRILDGTPASDLARRRTVEGSANQRLLMPVMRRVGASLSRLLPANLVRHVEQLLVQAGEPMSLGAFLTIWLIVAGSLVLFSAWLSLVAAGLGTLPLILIVALMNLYGTFAPYAFLRGKAERRKNETEKALPDALDLLLTSSQAGLSVDAAFALVAQRTHGPLAEQFTEYLKRVGLGRSSRDALNDIDERSGATSLKRLASIVAQATEVGTQHGRRDAASGCRIARGQTAQGERSCLSGTNIDDDSTSAVLYAGHGSHHSCAVSSTARGIHGRNRTPIGFLAYSALNP